MGGQNSEPRPSSVVYIRQGTTEAHEMDHNAAIIGPAYHKLSARPRGNIHRLIGRQIDER